MSGCLLRKALLSALLLLMSLPLLGGRARPGSAFRGWDVFVIAGQSNAVGMSSEVTRAAPPTQPTLAYTLWDSWIRVEDPWIHRSPTVRVRVSSPWPSFALRLVTLGRKVALIASAKGGSCLVAGPAEWDPTSGPLYQRMLDRVVQAGAEGHVKAVLWHQGECDAQQWWNDGTDPVQAQALYKAGLETLADAVARDLGAVLVAAPISLTRCRWSNPDCTANPGPPAVKRIPVHDATLQAAAEHWNIVLGPLSDDLRHEPDNVHIHEVTLLGLRWADALQAAGL